MAAGCFTCNIRINNSYVLKKSIENKKINALRLWDDGFIYCEDHPPHSDAYELYTIYDENDYDLQMCHWDINKFICYNQNCHKPCFTIMEMRETDNGYCSNDHTV